MDEHTVRSLVKGWHARALQEEDPITRFVFLWLCFNAWLAYESDEDTDRGMIGWLTRPCAQASQLRIALELATGSGEFLDCLRTLTSLSPILSTRRRPQKPVHVTSPRNLSEIAWGVYRVRCNLFLGGKSIKDSRDQRLVRTCAQILEQWVNNLIAAWGVENRSSPTVTRGRNSRKARLRMDPLADSVCRSRRLHHSCRARPL